MRTVLNLALTRLFKVSAEVRQSGVITRWQDDRGFGFITTDGAQSAGESSVFVHVSEFPAGADRPAVGDAVTFRLARDDRNRPRAVAVRYVNGKRGARGSHYFPAAVIAAAFFTVLGGLALFGFLPWLVVAISALLSLVTFGLYGADKAAAIRGEWRISEATLQLAALLGGWPGALLAQQVYRHKTRKRSFQTVFWVNVVINCVALAWFVFARPLPF
jgi:uncharacterized membrane protein YsdA (DUF1294 family)/cold shock CspA family protein